MLSDIGCTLNPNPNPNTLNFTARLRPGSHPATGLFSKKSRTNPNHKPNHNHDPYGRNINLPIRPNINPNHSHNAHSYGVESGPPKVAFWQSTFRRHSSNVTAIMSVQKSHVFLVPRITTHRCSTSDTFPFINVPYGLTGSGKLSGGAYWPKVRASFQANQTFLKVGQAFRSTKHSQFSSYYNFIHSKYGAPFGEQFSSPKHWA